MAEVTDDRGAIVRCPAFPRRIVSLVPSATETLFDLGVGDRVVGVTRFCERPEAARALPKVGGTKDVETDRVAALTPDLVVANCEENTVAILDALAPIAPVYAAFPRNIDDALHDLRRLGILVGAADAAEAWARRIEAGRATLHAAAGSRPRRTVVPLIWRRPTMSVGLDTFARHVLAEAGLDVVVPDGADRYPTLTDDALRKLDPDLVLLLSEPFPFRARHADALAAATDLPRDRFRAIDGQVLTWHGTRLAHGLPTLAGLVAGRFSDVR